MKSRPFPLILALSLLFLPVAYPEGGMPRWYSEYASQGTIIVETRDSELSHEVAHLLENWQQRMVRNLKLPISPRTRLLARVDQYPGTSLTQRLKISLLNAWFERGLLNLQITSASPSVVGSEDYLHRLTEASLYQMIYRESRSETLGGGEPLFRGDHLPRLPFWLVEGCYQGALESNADQNAKIIQRANFLHKGPQLVDVLGWKTASEDPLERYWRSAYCWQAVRFAVQETERREALFNWLILWAQDDQRASLPWKIDDSLESAWVSSRSDPGFKPEGVIFSWNRTAAELAKIHTVLLPGDQEDSGKVLVGLTELETCRARPGFFPVVQDKMNDLSALEMRANFSWRPVIAAYRNALASLLDPRYRPGTYPVMIALAQKQAQTLNNLSQKVTDYLNWFEVTQLGSGNNSAFQETFLLKEQIAAFTQKIASESEGELIRIEKKTRE